MMRKSILPCGIALLLAMTVVTGFAFGQAPGIDYYGFAWEDGGFPPSNPGDVLYFTGVGNGADPIFGVDLGTEELTFYIHDLVSTGEFDVAGTTVIAYTGGTLEIYRDGAQNADWGVAPPNPTSPATFNDGTLFFQGAFNDFTIFIAPGGYGSFEGTLDGVAGEVISEVCTGCAYSWGGSFTLESGAQIPAGYDLQIDGVFEIEAAVSTETTNWGSLKALYRD
jgi:hypothetical protein